MLASAIRELAASKNSLSIAAAFFESTVQVWDVRTRTMTSQFPTLFCLGARNLALAPNAATLVVGLSAAHGQVAAYEVPSGKKVWERAIAYPSSLRFDPGGQSILCSNNRKSVLRLETRTGATIQTINGVRRYIEGPNGEVLVVPAGKEKDGYQLNAGGRTFHIRRTSSALLDAVFSPDSVCVTETKGPVRCISRDDGSLRCMFDFGTESHVPRLHYSPKLGVFWGILQNLNRPNFRHLIRFDVASGAYERICDLNSWEEVFLDATDQLITSSGEIRDLSNGAVTGQLTFPLKDYPDK